MHQLNRRSFFRAAGGTAVAAAAGPLLLGCGSSGTKNDLKANAKVVLPKHIPYTGVTSDLPPEPAGVMPGFLRYPAEPVTGVPEKAGSGEELTAFIMQIRPVPPPMDKNEFWQNINDNLGLTLKLQMVPSPDFADKLATLIAGGEVPDFTMISGTPRLPQLLDAKFQDLTEFVSGDAIKDYPMLANLREEHWRQMVYNAGIYGVPIPREPVGNIVFVRMDIVREKGLNESPTTFAEFKELADGLTDSAQNQWAFSSPTGMQSLIQRMMGAPPGWKEEGGKFTSENELETTKEALARARELVDAGYFHPDWATDAPPAKDWFGAGKVAIVHDNYSAWPGYIMLYKGQYPEMDIDGIMPPKYDSSSTPNIARGNPSFSITAFKKTDDKERIKLMLRVCNYLAASFGTKEYLANRYGVEGVDFEFSEDGDPILNQKGTAETTAEFYRVADAPWALYEPGHPEETRKEHAYQLKAVPIAIPSKAQGLYSETNSAKGATIGELLTTTQREILQGRKDVSEWDDAVKKWREQGGDQIRTEYEEAFQTAKELGQ